MVAANNSNREQKAILEIVRAGVSRRFLLLSSGSTQTPPAIPRIIRDRANALRFHIEIDHYDTSVSTTDYRGSNL
jgi:non-ribosomal peptide synthetase component E (peptide arylation enzyme)